MNQTLLEQRTTAAAELRRRYAIEHGEVFVALAAIADRVTAEYPAPDGDGPVTRYDLDMMRALKGQLEALLAQG